MAYSTQLSTVRGSKQNSVEEPIPFGSCNDGEFSFNQAHGSGISAISRIGASQIASPRLAKKNSPSIPNEVIDISSSLQTALVALSKQPNNDVNFSKEITNQSEKTLEQIFTDLTTKHNFNAKLLIDNFEAIGESLGLSTKACDRLYRVLKTIHLVEELHLNREKVEILENKLKITTTQYHNCYNGMKKLVIDMQNLTNMFNEQREFFKEKFNIIFDSNEQMVAFYETTGIVIISLAGSAVLAAGLLGVLGILSIAGVAAAGGGGALLTTTTALSVDHFTTKYCFPQELHAKPTEESRPSGRIDDQPVGSTEITPLLLTQANNHTLSTPSVPLNQNSLHKKQLEAELKRPCRSILQRMLGAVFASPSETQEREPSSRAQTHAAEPPQSEPLILVDADLGEHP